MLEITTPRGPLLLPPDTSIALELNSPLFDEQVVLGQYSLDFTVATPANASVLGYPAQADRAADLPRDVESVELADNGLPLLTGKLRVRRATSATTTLNLLAGLSAVATSLKERSLTTYALGGPVDISLTTYPEYAVSGEPLGLLIVANATVRDPYAHSHVFAPLCNPRALKPDAPADWVVVNPWFAAFNNVYEPSLPSDGSFYLNNGTIVVPLGDVASTSEVLFPMTPFPRLDFVLRSVLAELGLSVPDQLLPGELADLVLITNHVLHPIDLKPSFSLQDFVPDVTVAELLLCLRNAFGLVITADATGRVTAQLRRDAVLASEFVDLSHRLIGEVELEYAEPAGTTFTYTFDSDDQAIMEPADYDAKLVKDPVATFADLPNYPDLLPPTYYAGISYPAPPEIRLVIEENAWYKGITEGTGGTSSATTWTKLGDNLLPFDVGGGGSEVEQGFAPMATALITDNYDYAIAGIYPFLEYRLGKVSMPVVTVGDLNFQPTKTIRLAFYRGLQTYKGVSTYRYPLLTPLNISADGSRGWDNTLELEGNDGTYNRFLKAWQPVGARPVQAKATLLLAAAELSALRLTGKIRLHGVDYLVKRLSAAVPLLRGITAEIVRV